MLYANIFALFLFILIASGSILDKNKLKHVTFLDESNFDNFIEHPAIRAVAFYEPFPESTEKHESEFKGQFQNVNHTSFLPLYQNASKYLMKFKIDTGLVDCTKTPSVGKCGNTDANNVFIYGYRNSKSVVKLSYENLFGGDSIIGSLLHLNIINRMPIINNAQKFDDRILVANRGKADVLFGYFQYIGDPEHRAFVEAAYSYLDDFAFVIITDKDTFEQARFYETLQKEEQSKVYLFLCKERKDNEECPHVIYRGGLDKDNMTIYMNNLKGASKTFDLPRDGKADVLKHLKIHTAYLFYDKQSKELVKQIAEKLRNTFLGVLGVVTVDAEHSDFKNDFEEIKKPGFALKLIGEKYPIHMTHKFSEANVLQLAHKRIEEHRLAGLGEKDKPKDPVLVMDDEVASPVYTLSLLPQSAIITDHITALTDKTFAMITSRNIPTLVLFYTEYDPACMAFLRSFSEAAMAEANRTSLTRVNCFDWTDVCTAQKVAHYPHIRVYQSGQEPLVYRGMLDGKAVIDFLNVIELGTPLEITCSKKAGLFLDGSYPEGIHGLKVDATIFVGLSNAEDIQVVEAVADSFGGDIFLAYGTGDVANMMCDRSVPCLVVRRQNEPEERQIINSALNVRKLTDIIQASRLPAVSELTVASLPKIFAQKKPIVIYFGDEMDTEYQAVQSLARTGDSRDYIFTWVNCVEVDSIGMSVLHTYHPKANLPALALVNLDMGNVYMPEKPAFTIEGIEGWMNSLASGKETPVYVMPETNWKPANAGYDYEALKKQKYERGEDAGAGGRLRGAKTEETKARAHPEDMGVKAKEEMMKNADMEKKTSVHEEL